MKKANLLLLVVGLLASCNNPKHTTNPEEELFDLTFSVSGFSQTIEPMSRGGLDGVVCLGYSIFTGSGSFVKKVMTNSGDENFGTFTEKLPAGNYDISIYAANEMMEILDDESTTSSTHAVPLGIKEPEYWPIGYDVFTFSSTITVDSHGTYDPVLTRPVGMIEVVIDQGIPADVNSIDITIENYCSTYKPFSSNPSLPDYNGKSTGREHLSTEFGEESTTFRYYVLGKPNISHKYTVKIDGWKTNGSAGSRTINNVEVFANKKTILKGQVFEGGNQNTGFTVTIDSDWDPEPNTIDF